MCGFGVSKFKLGGIWRWWTESINLISPAMPDAPSRWPILVFTEPMSSGLVTGAFVAKDPSQSVCFDGVTQRRTRAMSLDVMDIRGLNTRSCAGLFEHVFPGPGDSVR